jgi:hypothetical protein
MAREKRQWSTQIRKSGDETVRRLKCMGVREVIIVVAAEIDAALGEVIAKRLTGPEKEVQRFVNGPLGNFGPRIDLAWMLGLLDPMDAKALHALQDLRNAAAHHVEIKVGDANFEELEKQLAGTWVGVGGVFSPAAGQSEDDRIKDGISAMLLVYQYVFTQLLHRMQPVGDISYVDPEEEE